MLNHKSSQLTIQTAEKHEVALSHLIKHTNEVALSKGSPLGSFHSANVAYITIVAYGVVIDIVTYLLNQAVVAHCNVAQCGIVDTRVL